MSDNLVCPNCGNTLTLHEARSDSGGGYWRPYVSCKCGFSFHAPGTTRDIRVEPGESGWAADARDTREVLVLLKYKFKASTKVLVEDELKNSIVELKNRIVLAERCMRNAYAFPNTPEFNAVTHELRPYREKYPISLLDERGINHGKPT